MKLKRSTIFASLAALSLLLAAIVAIAWFNSFSSPWQLFSFHKDEEKYALRSQFGQFVLLGPPIEQLTNPLPGDLISQMSNADFDWSEIGSQWVCGTLRRDTATWQVYRRLAQRIGRGQSLEPAMRIWIAQARNDPNHFVPADMLLMLAAEPRRTRPRYPNQRWLETGFHFDADGARIPEVIVPADVSKKPDFANRWDLKQEWADVMESTRAAIFHGWIWLGAMLLPLAFITKPRWRKTTFRRCAFNFLSLVLAIICLAAMALWVRSQVVDEQFLFARRPASKVNNLDLDSITSIASSKGKLLIIRSDVFRQQSTYRDTWGYQQKTPRWPASVQGLPLIGEKSARFAGVEFYELPSQMLTFSTRTVLAAGRAPMAPGPISQAYYGVRALCVRWWLIVFASALIPAWWLINAVIWRKRILKEDRQLSRQCPACGYDTRATPQQCPECGHTTAPL